MKGFNLPIISEVPVETAVELNIRGQQDKAYADLRLQKIKKKHMKLNSDTRKVADYIQNNFLEDIDLNKVSQILDIKVNKIKIVISDLNFWLEFGYKMKRVKGKKDFVQSVKKNINDTEDYIRKKSRTITSLEQVYGNIDKEIQFTRPKQRVKQEVEQSRKERKKQEKIKVENSN